MVLKVECLRTVIPIKIYYHDDHEKGITLTRKIQLIFFLNFDKSENILFALEFYRRLKNANLLIDYYAFNNSQNDRERGITSEMIELRIETKKVYRMYISSLFL